MSMLDPNVRGGAAVDYDASNAPSDLSADRHLRVGYDETANQAVAQEPPEPAPPPPVPPVKKPRRARKFFLVLFLLALAWAAWAAGAFYDLTAGLQSGDPVALERRIEWNGVREALREDLQAGGITPSAERPIDALLSRPAVANLLRSAKVDNDGWDTSPRPPQSRFDWRRIKYAFFTGSPFAFRIDLRPDGDATRQPLVLLFRWTGDWRLSRVFLPAPGPDPSTGAAQGAARPSDAPAAPPPPGAQRATLFEEVPNDLQGKRHHGSVVWRTEQTPSVTGGPPTLTVMAQVNIPDRPLKMTLAIRRNLDQTLPASHMIDVNFDLPANTDTGGIRDITGIIMKATEEATGQTLAGSRVKVQDGFFLFGLSSMDVDLRHNVQLVTDRPWIGLPIRYGNGGRAVLVIEKGETGSKTLAEAFAQWSAAPASGAAQKK